MKKLFGFLAGCLIGFSVHAGGIDNPSSGLLPGVAIGQAATYEISTTNGMVSENFTAGTTWFDWVPSGGITAAFNTTFNAPNGTTTASTLTTTAGGTTSVWGAQTVGGTFPVGTKGVCSLFVRAGTSARMRFECGDTGGGGGFPYPNFVEFNPATGQTFSANGLTLINSINVNGIFWWRLGVAWTSAGGNPQLMITPASASLTATGTLHVWGAMIEQSTNTANTPSNYLPNTSTAGANLSVPGKIHTSFLDHSTEEVFTSVTGNYTLLGTDSGKVIIGNSTATTITAPTATIPNGFWFDVLNRRTGAGTLTLSGGTFSGAGLPTAGSATLVFPSTSSDSALINCGHVRVTAIGGYNVDCVAQARGNRTFTSGSTWTAPRNVTWIYVSAVGGGGGGGGDTGAGGAGGSTCISATAGTCAGAPIFRAIGGAGGAITNGGTALGGTGGTGTTTNGYPGFSAPTAVVTSKGGDSPWGQGGNCRSGTTCATAPAGLGAGGYSGQASGVAGGGGEIALKSPINVVPGTTYTITIGAAGAAGTDFTAAPSAGTAGYMLIEW